MRVLLLLAGLIALGLSVTLTFCSIVTEVSYSEPIPGIPDEFCRIQYTIVTYPHYGLGFPLFIAGLILVLRSLRFSPEAHRMPSRFFLANRRSIRG